MICTVAGQLIESGRLGLLPAVFNPPTFAHLALASEAQRSFDLDQVAFALPDAPPHKVIARPAIEQRLNWLARLADRRPDRAVVTCPGGLVIEIVRSIQATVTRNCEIFVIAGRDAAERYASWDYEDRESFADQLRHYSLLVAARNGAYSVASEFAHRVFPFEIDARFDAASSTAVREAIRAGRPWHQWVPPELREEVAAAYREVEP